jgi:hypothetical protein
MLLVTVPPDRNRIEVFGSSWRLLVTFPLDGNRMEVFGSTWTGKEVVRYNGKDVSTKRSFRFESTHVFYVVEDGQSTRFALTFKIPPLSSRVRYRVSRNGVTVAEDQTRMGSPEVSSKGLLWDIRGVLVSAGAIYVVDALIVGAPMIIGLVLIALVFWLVPRTIAAYRNRQLLKRRAASAAIYLLLVCLSFGTYALNEHIARERAHELIAACEAYKAEYGHYPDKLKDLVPEFVSRIPVAKYALLTGDFLYPVSNRVHILMYIRIPPFGRALYTLEEGRWSYLD